MISRRNWRVGAVASAIALLGGLASLEAHALALGKITVQSALGEPLRAEIDIAEMTADEAASLKVGIATPDTFKSAGLEYTAVLTGIDVKLMRRANGRSYLQLNGNRPVTEPFVDMVLEANWSAGRITRDYTMLFDPPNTRAGSAAAPVVITAPVLSAPAVPVRPLTATPNAALPQPPVPLPPPAPKVAATPVPKPALIEPIPSAAQKIIVRPGDTAGRIAAQTKPVSVSLDQMLAALLRSNPNAFIGGNVNRIKSGSVLDVPSAQAASAVSPEEATQTILAQSKDFNTFRRKLAEGVGTTTVANADRQAGGKLQAEVQDRAPTVASPDKLTLSKGAVQSKAASAANEGIALRKQVQDTSTRLAELSKNITELNKLESAATAADPAGPAAPVVRGAPAMQIAPLIAGSASSSAQSASSAPVMSSVTVSSAAAPVKPVDKASAPPSTGSSVMAYFSTNPLVWPLVISLLALLTGFGLYRYRQRKKATPIDSAFIESRLQPDSFFGASGGQHIDTKENIEEASSLIYTPSQLDAASDVDPVAEADVYLAYGRDLQAEEILKEALRTNPARLAIYAKLMEIYAKRRDSKAFEAVAIEAFKLPRDTAPEWNHINEMGQKLDATNPLYQSATQPTVKGVETTTLTPLNSPRTTPNTAPSKPDTVKNSTIDFGHDPDFLKHYQSGPDTLPGNLASKAPEKSDAKSPMVDLDMDFDSEMFTLPKQPFALSTPKASSPDDEFPPKLSFSMSDLDFGDEPAKTQPSALTSSQGSKPENSLLEFDFSSLSLDLPASTTQKAPQTTSFITEDPLETKFALAQEFKELGDPEGAKSLAEEVLNEAQGSLKIKAQAFIKTLSSSS